jgi:hypothetical protein
MTDVAGGFNCASLAEPLMSRKRSMPADDKRKKVVKNIIFSDLGNTSLYQMASMRQTAKIASQPNCLERSELTNPLPLCLGT